MAQSNVNRPPTVFGSTEFTTSLSPKASAPSWRIAVTPCTPGVPASALATAGSVGDQPSAPVTTCVALTRRSSEPVVESRRPWATTVTRVTSATPIIIAEAVTAVRPGLRIALRRASRPAEPPTRSATRPITEASRRTPRAGRRTFSEPGAASRRAATGGTRVARHAGTRPASRVTTVPTSSETITVRAANTMPASGRSMSIEANTASRPLAMPKPAPRPISEASTPITSASISTDDEHLAARRADHPQQPELARALGDGDRERVEDRERAHEDGHEAEHDQDRRDDPDEHLQPVEGEAVLRLRGLHLRGRAELAGDRLADVRGRGPVLADGEDRVVAAGLAEQLLRGVAGRTRRRSPCRATSRCRSGRRRRPRSPSRCRARRCARSSRRRSPACRRSRRR